MTILGVSLLEKIYIGIDLAAREYRCSGFAYIVCKDVCRVADVYCLYGDSNILDAITKLSIDGYSLYISIDAPFSLGSGMRNIDRKMVSLGFRVFPPGFSYMKLLTLRAMNIIKRLKAMSITNIYETHPKSSMASSRCNSVRELLEKLNIVYTIDVDALDRDRSDAIICAVVSYCIDRGCYIKIEDVDGVIWLLNKICT